MVHDENILLEENVFVVCVWVSGTRLYIVEGGGVSVADNKEE